MIEELYFRKRENTSVGRIIREQMGFTESGKKSPKYSPRIEENEENERKYDRKERSEKKYKFGEERKYGNGGKKEEHNNLDILTFGSPNAKSLGKKKKSVRIIESEQGDSNLFGVKFGNNNEEKSRDLSNHRSLLKRKNSLSPT